MMRERNKMTDEQDTTMRERSKTSKLRSVENETTRRRTIRRASNILSSRAQNTLLAELKRPEIIALVASCLLALIALAAYFLWLVPSRNQLAANEDEYRRLHAQLTNATKDVKTSENTQASVEEIERSLHDFEESKLPSRAASRTVTIEELNALIRRDGLRISNGVTFTPLNNDVQGVSGSQQTSVRGNNVKQNVYPGIGITLSVEGAYPSVRRFLRDIEMSRQFIVINGVQLESIVANTTRTSSNFRRGALNGTKEITSNATTSNTTPNANNATSVSNESATTTNSSLVSLRLDMAAYFRPERKLSEEAGTQNNTSNVSPSPTSPSSLTSKPNSATQ